MFLLHNCVYQILRIKIMINPNHHKIHRFQLALGTYMLLLTVFHGKKDTLSHLSITECKWRQQRGVQANLYNFIQLCIMQGVKYCTDRTHTVLFVLTFYKSILCTIQGHLHNLCEIHHAVLFVLFVWIFNAGVRHYGRVSLHLPELSPSSSSARLPKHTHK